MVVCSRCGGPVVESRDLPARPSTYKAPGLVSYLTLHFSRPELLDALGERVGFTPGDSGRVTKDQLAETIVLIMALEGDI
jgi:hypothetical protein